MASVVLVYPVTPGSVIQAMEAEGARAGARPRALRVSSTVACWA